MDAHEFIPLDAQAAVLDYDAKFATALQQYPEPIGTQFSYKSTGGSLIRRFHIPLDAAGYEKFKGTLPFRRLSSKFFDVHIQTWADGVAELADIVEAVDFNGFSTQPEIMARNAKMFPDDQLAGIINDGENLESLWEDATGAVHFLDTDHPNSLIGGGAPGAFRNFWSSLTFDDAGVTTLLNALLTRVGANGKSLGLMGTHLVVAPDLYEAAWRLMKVPLLSGGGSNPLFGRLEPVMWPQLKAGRFFVTDKSRNELAPLITVIGPKGETPETITHDKSSPLYGTTLQIGFNAVLRMGFGAGMPHALAVGQVP